MLVKMVVLLAGLALIAFIGWWFFGKHVVATASATATAAGQSVDIEVKGGYSPERVVLKQGVPATLNFTRQDASTCLDHVVFAELGINQELPQGQTEQIQIDTSKPGEYDWACGMDMFHGKLIVE
jgi:plastocyanin domain-containing protein